MVFESEAAAERARREASELEAIVAQAKVRLRIRSPFFATLALFAEFAFDARVAVAETDGKRVVFSPAYVRRADSVALEVTLLHEVLHAALLHPSRRKSRDPEVWNAAADIVVNGILVAQGLPLPHGALRDAGLEDWRVEDIYELLLRERAIRPPQKAPPDLASLPELEVAAGTSRAKELETTWQTAMREAMKAHERAGSGELPSALARFVRASVATRLDWRAQLWRHLALTPTDFEGFDRRFIGQGLYLETLGGTSLRILLCVDTSGSIDGKMLSSFMSEVDEIARTYPHLEIELFFADRALHGPYPFRKDGAAAVPLGGGGTSFAAFFEHAEKVLDVARASLCVYFTDGHGTFPRRAPPCPTLWVVPEKGAKEGNFPFGDVVRMSAID